MALKKLADIFLKKSKTKQKIQTQIQTPPNLHTQTRIPVMEKPVPPPRVPEVDRVPELSRERSRQESEKINIERIAYVKFQDALHSVQTKILQR